jgi:hypothetical protein
MLTQRRRARGRTVASRLGVVGAVGGLILFVTPAANAACVWCDETGCHVTTGPCPPPPPPPPPHKPHNRCKYGGSGDPSGAIANPGTKVGVLSGGPFVVADVFVGDSTHTTTNPMSATATCHMKVGGTGHYDEPDSVSMSASGTAVVLVPPTLVSFAASSTDPVWECTTVTVRDAEGRSATYYEDDVTGDFTLDASTAQCALAISQQVSPQEVCDLIPLVCDMPVLKP